MFERMRRVFGPAAVGVIIGGIAMVFVFYGVYNPRSTGAGGTVAVQVNGDSVSITDFNRELQARISFYQNMMKGKVDPSVFDKMGIRQQVMEELIRKRLVLQETERLGFRISDDEVRERVMEMPYFKKDGKFDQGLYQRILEANRYSPATFEQMVRDDSLRGQMAEFVRARSIASEEEVRREFLVSEDRRQVDYVAVTRDYAKKLIVVSDKDIDELLTSETGKKNIQSYYEQNKFAYAKEAKPAAKNGKDAVAKDKDGEPQEEEFLPLEQVKRRVATDILRERKNADVEKIIRESADALLAAAKQGPAQVRAAAQKRGLTIKTSEKFNRQQGSIPDMGEQEELVSDAFASSSFAPKAYESRGSRYVAWGLRSFPPEMAEFAKSRERIVQSIVLKKEQSTFDAWMRELRAKAKIKVNTSLVEAQNEAG